MRVFILLLCLVLVIISSAGAEQKNAELSREDGGVVDRQVREAGQQVRNKSGGKQKKKKKTQKVNRKNQEKQDKPRRKKKLRDALQGRRVTIFLPFCYKYFMYLYQILMYLTSLSQISNKSITSI